MTKLPVAMNFIAHGAGGAPEVLVPAQGPLPSPAPDEVLIRVLATGVNRPDVAQREGSYPPPPGASPSAGGPPEYAFRVRRLGADFLVDARALPGGGAALPPWSQLRMAHLVGAEGPGTRVQVGLYACSPLGAGFAAHFRAFSISPGRLPQDVKAHAEPSAPA